MTIRVPWNSDSHSLSFVNTVNGLDVIYLQKKEKVILVDVMLDLECDLAGIIQPHIQARNRIQDYIASV